ncbi:ABC transporter permease [Streptomyces sp. WY228]|uniref:ABC transporter permease n=1 Tax=Streptomyces sp. WY228 TaxID=2855836 RepID=UPI00211B71BA|nr:ABC transporter permease [Streptomyces sp. WY228]
MTRTGRGRGRLKAARLSPRDVAHVGSSGLRSRPMRVVLSALGIAIGIATMISVVGISASSQAQLLRELDKLGTNLLVASPGESMFAGEDVKLPEESVGMVGQIKGVQDVGATADLNATVRRNEKVDEGDTGGIAVKATTAGLLRVLRGEVGSGRWLNAATGRYPSVVLGHVSAERLGVTEPGQQVWLGDRTTVTGDAACRSPRRARALAGAPRRHPLGRRSTVGRPATLRSTIRIRAGPRPAVGRRDHPARRGLATWPASARARGRLPGLAHRHQPARGGGGGAADAAGRPAARTWPVDRPRDPGRDRLRVRRVRAFEGGPVRRAEERQHAQRPAPAPEHRAERVRRVPGPAAFGGPGRRSGLTGARARPDGACADPRAGGAVPRIGGWRPYARPPDPRRGSGRRLHRVLALDWRNRSRSASCSPSLAA